MKFGRFINGGYYLHKVAGYWKGWVSAWFDRDGNLLDAEQIFWSFGPSRPVKRDGPMWREVCRIGQRYKHTPAP